MELTIKDVRVLGRYRPRYRYNARLRRGESARAADWREYEAKTRVYFDVVGEDVLDNIANRRARPWQAYRALMPRVLKQLGLPPETKFRWSQHAGCTMCPCSPGMILDTVVKCLRPEDPDFPEMEHPANVWVTITGEEHPEFDKAKMAEQLATFQVVEVP